MTIRNRGGRERPSSTPQNNPKGLVYININDLIPYENNPRINDKAVDAVAASIKEFGFKVPIVVDKNNVIVAGHTRLKAAQKLGLEEVPVIVADDLTEDKIKAFRLADNKVGELADWDFSKLEEELANIEMDMSQFDFDMKELQNELENQEVQDVKEDNFDIDEAIENIEEPVCQPGDVWQLGNHRLVCGDSTDKATIEKLMNGHVADMVFTDPPYGMKKEKDGVMNDNLNYDDLLEFNKQWIPLTLDTLKDMGGWYCWGIDEPLMDIYSHILKPLARANKIVLRNYITWAKHSAFGLKSSLCLSYPRETEKCWFVVKGQDWNNNNAEFFNYKYLRVLEYLDNEAEKVGLNAKRLHELTNVQMWSHWFSKSQFTVISQKYYEVLQNEYNKDGAFLLSYEELRGLIGEVNDKKQPVKPFFDVTWFDDGDMPLSDVWRNSITTQKERELTGGHATPKPLKICERAIRTSTRENEIVLDVFGGSGSTLIACEQLNRACYMLELDPKYCDVIINRWETITGKKAELVKE